MHRCAMFIAAILAFAAASVSAADAPQPWPAVTLADPSAVQLHGPLGDALDRAVARLAHDPYTEKYIRADVSFEMERIFTNYSGDVSGRFLELASLVSPKGEKWPATLAPILETVPKFQKADGHFGVDVDLAKPLIQDSPPIPMLWGNGRILVGLITAARVYGDEKLLAAAKKLGDFYVNSADQLCAPAREAEYKKSGSYGGSYTCCYFPGIEGLAMLYQATKDELYLKQAVRMAEWFKKFDALPIDHSHANLCAYRGILPLYEITGDRAYLDRAREKWDAAVKGGYVWSLGGVGEHWYVNFNVDEGCSESDWLRFNLDLWRFTGETRYLDMAERLLWNQYLANQSPTGGFGARHFDGDAAGPIGTRAPLDEWPFCCSFHGPLGLWFLKGYLVTGTERGIYVNLPMDFTGPVKAVGIAWKVTTVVKPDPAKGQVAVETGLACDEASEKGARVWVRRPAWAFAVKEATVGGKAVEFADEGGYVAVKHEFVGGEKLRVVFEAGLAAEGRKFQPMTAEAGKTQRLKDVTLLVGPHVLFAAPVADAGRPVLLATVDKAGRLALPDSAGLGGATVALPSADATDAEVAKAIESARVVLLKPYPAFSARRRAAFQCDLVVVPADSISEKARDDFVKRAKEAEAGATGTFFGADLEKRTDIWLAPNGWRFTPEGIHVTEGDVGLLDGDGYGDYRLEFEMVLPKEGQGIGGWIVRARSASDCLMYQIQSADSPFDAPQFKTKPNTLRPHIRRGGQWTVLDPVALPKDVKRGEVHKVATECRGDKIEVFLDGEKIHTQTVPPEFKSGTIGFRAGAPAEQGLYRHVTLTK